MIILHDAAPLPTASHKPQGALVLILATLLMLSACSQHTNLARRIQIGDPLATNRVLIHASFLPDEPFLQRWTVVHQAPFILPVGLAEVSRIDFEVGSRSPWLVSFHNWSGVYTAEPPATLTVTAARWNLTARTERNELLEASIKMEPGLELVLAGACEVGGCPYEFSQPDRADDWLSFSIDSDDFPGLASDWLRPRDEVKITVDLAVWLNQDGATESGAGDADFLSVIFHLTSQGSSLLVASR